MSASRLRRTALLGGTRAGQRADSTAASSGCTTSYARWRPGCGDGAESSTDPHRLQAGIPKVRQKALDSRTARSQWAVHEWPFVTDAAVRTRRHKHEPAGVKEWQEIQMTYKPRKPPDRASRIHERTMAWRQRIPASTQVLSLEQDARIKSECAKLEELVAKYGFNIPPAYFAYLLKCARPAAGPVTDAIIISCISAEASLPRIDCGDTLYWPLSLRVLHWVFSGQQAAIWDHLRRASTEGRASAVQIEGRIEIMRAEFARRPVGVGGPTGAGIWAGIHRAWLALLPPVASEPSASGR